MHYYINTHSNNIQVLLFFEIIAHLVSVYVYSVLVLLF